MSELELWFLPAGDSCDHPLELVQSPRMRHLLEEVREQFDWVLIDSAPLLVADASILSRLADGTLVVVRNDATQKQVLQDSLTGLEKLLGFVLNDCAGIKPHGYEQYYAYAPGNGNGHSVAGPAQQSPAQQSPAPATES
jgi:Mrp family chromosome partitioning ATPase